MKIGITKLVNIEAKTLNLCLKVCDGFSGSINDQDGFTIKSFEDCYVPSFMPGDHFGDYVILIIDIDTGQITNWETPTAQEIEDFINAK